jgi:hypothetical protein
MFGICSHSKLYFVRISVDIDPVHNGRVFANARNKPRVFEFWVREKVTCEGMTKSLVILRAGVYIELCMKVNSSISTACDAVKCLVA